MEATDETISSNMKGYYGGSDKRNSNSKRKKTAAERIGIQKGRR